jgi:monoamine oxidase
VELPEVKTRAIAELGYGTNAKLMMGFRERVWRERHGSNGRTLTDLPFQVTWETSQKHLGGMPVGRLYFAGEHRSLHAQGYMEGRCETGERAAAEILQALGS